MCGVIGDATELFDFVLMLTSNGTKRAVASLDQVMVMSRVWLGFAVLLLGLASGVARAQESGGVASSYVSEPGGYAVDYPSAWSLEEHVDESGILVTTFTDAGGTVLTIASTPNAAVVPGSVTDLPHVRCQAVRLGELEGQRCVDTLSRTVTTTIITAERTFTFMHALFANDELEPVLQSFRQWQAPPVEPAPSGE
jgi:hypothetical protein